MKERNYGIDLFRIVAMLLAVLVHIVGQGGILGALAPHSLNYETARILDILSVCAVNCFALISGFVGYESKFRVSNILYLWLQVMFYSVIITVLWALVRPGEVSANGIITSFLPVSFRQYWYFTSYFCLFFFMPLLNRLVRNMGSAFHLYLSIVLLVLFSLLPALCGGDLFYTGRGYSPLWLGVMYYFGALFKKYPGISGKFTKRTSLLLYLGSAVLVWLLKRLMEAVNVGIVNKYLYHEFMISYTGPFTVLASFMLLFLFAKIRPKQTKWISFVSPLVFGVYLVHVHPIVFGNLFTNAFARLASLSMPLMVVCILLCSVAVFGICALIDWLRLLLFRALHIRELCEKAGSCLEKWFRNTSAKLLSK